MTSSFDIDVTAARLSGPLLYQVFLAGGTVDQAFVDNVVDGFVSAHPVSGTG